MNTRTRLTSALFLFLGISTSANAEGWLCIADHSAGFVYDEQTKNWRSGNFEADDKYIIKKADKNQPGWVVNKFGMDGFPASVCKNEITEENATLTCDGFYFFRFNAKNKRFFSVYTFGYVTFDPASEDFSKENDNTPSMSIGTCAKL